MIIRKVKFLKIFLIFIFYFLLFINNSSFLVEIENSFNEQNQDSEPNGIEDLGELKITGNPGNFVLSSNKYQLYNGQTFNLSWTPSDGADNYSIYVSNSPISIININCTKIKDNITNLSYEISNNVSGSYYYVAVAYNESGNTLSNNVNIKILSPLASSSSGDSDDVDSYPMIVSINILILILVIISIITAAMIVGLRARYHFRAEFPSIPHDNVQDIENVKIKKSTIKTTQEIVNEAAENQELFYSVKNNQFETNFNLLKKSELTTISDILVKRIDELNWKSENDKEQFIYEILSLTPEEREEILDYMFEKLE